MAELTGKKVAILAETLYEDQELWYPYYRMREAGAEVHVVGPHKGTFESKHGYPVNADCAAEEIKAADFDAVIIPGGYAPDHMRRNQAMVDLVRDAVQQGKVVAAICHAGWMLASAGVLKGRRRRLSPIRRWCRTATSSLPAFRPTCRPSAGRSSLR